MNTCKTTVRVLLFLIFFSINSSKLFTENLKPEYQKTVKPVINALKNHDISKLSTLIKYPLYRNYPIPPVRSRKEFIERFDEIFDTNLVNEILTSSIEDNWTNVGWRGIMLNYGIVWIDFDGKIIAVNYQTDKEKGIQDKLIEKEKRSLHKSLKKFKLPCLRAETKSLKIRIDDLGDNNYRYAVWPKGVNQSEKPDLIIKNGKWIPDGSGGNHYYEFIKGNYKYRVYIFVIGSDETPPGLLQVYKSSKLVSDQNIINIINH